MPKVRNCLRCASATAMFRSVAVAWTSTCTCRSEYRGWLSASAARSFELAAGPDAAAAASVYCGAAGPSATGAKGAPVHAAGAEAGGGSCGGGGGGARAGGGSCGGGAHLHDAGQRGERALLA